MAEPEERDGGDVQFKLWATFACMFLLALVPITVGVWMMWASGVDSALPMALIAFGPGVIGGLFVALTPGLERWSSRKRRGHPPNDTQLR